MRRAFRIRRAPGRGRALWQWECTLCHPPARGGCRGDLGWERIVRTSLPCHFRVREYHHRYVLKTRGPHI